MDGQFGGLGNVHPLLTFSFFSSWILPPQNEEEAIIHSGWTPKKCHVYMVEIFENMLLNILVHMYQITIVSHECTTYKNNCQFACLIGEACQSCHVVKFVK